jgi:hypothetical protein
MALLESMQAVFDLKNRDVKDSLLLRLARCRRFFYANHPPSPSALFNEVSS